MGALAELRAMGLSVTAALGGRVAVEPKWLITAQARTLIQARRAELLQDLRAETALLALVDRVATHYRCDAGELALMRRLALADPEASRECFEATARFDGIPMDDLTLANYANEVKR